MPRSEGPILKEIKNLRRRLVKKFQNEIIHLEFIDPYSFRDCLEKSGYKKEKQTKLIFTLYSFAQKYDEKLKKLFSLIVNVPRLWKWTKKDLGEIYKLTFENKSDPSEGPSNSFALVIAAQFDIWGSVLRDKFGVSGQTKENILKVLNILKADYPNDYPKISDDLPNIFRHNLVHCFGKSPMGPSFDLNIETKGRSLNKQKADGRYHINCKKLFDQFEKAVEKQLLIKYRNFPI